MKIFLIACMGSLGVLIRYFIDLKLTNNQAFPWATFISNMIGCLLVGLLAGLLQNKSNWQSQALIIGLCGGLTTFSSYTLQIVERLAKGEMTIGILYLVISPILGIFLCFAGLQITKV